MKKDDFAINGNLRKTSIKNYEKIDTNVLLTTIAYSRFWHCNDI